MPENILIAIAWPYANAEIHVGNITGSHLPGDIVARYHRLKGNHVLMVSGTDSHGTPVTLAADKAGRPVEEVYKAGALPMTCSQRLIPRIISRCRKPCSWP
jgi:methionyl-tRNA synthetase